MMQRRAADPALIAIVGALVAIGAVMVFSASSFVGVTEFHDPAYFLKRELVWLVLGGAAAWFAMKMDYGKLRAAAPYLYGSAVILLALVLVPGLGAMEGGAQRWFEFKSFSFEPSEFAKLAVVIMLAKIFADREDGAVSFNKAGWPALICVGICFGLVIREPDFGTASLFVITAAVMLYVAGAKILQMLAGVLIAVPTLLLFVYSSPYRRDRFTAFQNPWKDPQGTGYHIIQSLLALGSGGWHGLGLGESRQKFGYLPEQYTDFIFSIIGEELGFIGAAIVLALFLLLAYRGVRIAMKSDDRFGYYLAIGITSSIVLQALVNIGVVTSTWPVTGVPLPFISYGGTSLFISLFGVGIIAGVSRGRSRAALAADTRAKEDDDAYFARGRRHRRSSVPRVVTRQSALRRAR